MTFDHEAELREESRQSALGKALVELVAGIIIYQLPMINHWGRGRPGESLLQDIQRRCDQLSGWVEADWK